MQCFHLIKRERVARACCRHKIAVSANACRRRHLFLYPVYDVNARVELRGAHDVHVKADAALVVALKTDVFDCPKRSVWVGNYFNAGFFAQNADGSTIPVGNLADCGNIISQSKDNADWINVAKKKLTTIYTTNAGGCGMVQTDDLSAIPDLRAAVSGIPIARGGQQVNMDEIKAEGYDGSELYDTWHGFLGLRENYLVYAAAKCDYWQMFWILRALGVKDAIKLDGGGSFILHNGYEIAGTSENRRINNCGMWEG